MATLKKEAMTQHNETPAQQRGQSVDVCGVWAQAGVGASPAKRVCV